jgi:hypothetical protein
MQRLRAAAGISAATLTLWLAHTGVAFATVPQVSIAGNADNTGDLQTVATNLTGSIIEIVLYVVGFVALLYLIWSGFKYITAGGDAKKATDARAGIINAIIGLIIVVGAFFFIRIGLSAGNTLSTSDNTTVNLD